MTNYGGDKRDPRFFIIDNEIVTEYKLGPYAGWLYVAIVQHINHKTGGAFPSLTTLAEETGMSEPSVIKYLYVLVEKKLICIYQTEGEKGEHLGNYYELLPVEKVVKDINQGGKPALPGVVNGVEPNYTNTNKTNEQDVSKPKPFADTPPAVSSAPQDPPKPPTPQQAMFEAICHAFGYDWRTMTRVKQGNIGRIAAELRRGGALPTDIPVFYAWCVEKKWPDFTENVFATRWDNYKADSKTHESATPDYEPLTDAEIDAEWQRMFAGGGGGAS
jgi:hypothetical protein